MKVYGCVTTRNDVPLEVARHMAAACGRVGAAWGKSVSKHSVSVARNQAVVLAKAAEATHLFICDDDTYVPEDAVEKLLALDAPVATGVTATTKVVDGVTTPIINVAYSEQGGYPRFAKHWFDGVRPVRYCGTACMLIRMDVLDQLGFPWFYTNHTLADGRYESRTEDITLCDRCHEAGIPILAHGNVRCDHDREIRCASLIGEESDHYGSHGPALRALAKLHPGVVLEYGSGQYSTPLWLDQRAFPSVKALVSVDTVPTWIEGIRDDRLTFVQMGLEDMIDCDPNSADVVFIDCGADWDQGGAVYNTRETLLIRFAEGDAVVAIHDIDDPQLARAFKYAPYKFKAKYTPPGKPHTGIASNKIDVTKLAL